MKQNFRNSILVKISILLIILCLIITAYNRRYTEDRFEEFVKPYKRNSRLFSVIMCDIDNFKFFNDCYGHECGDQVLIHIICSFIFMRQGIRYPCKVGRRRVLIFAF
jgi:diguanylate cyclase (GGDEF)-like protein